jgi:thiamine pyrophosphokinase
MPRVFIIANGEPDFPDLITSAIGLDDLIICADGGSNHAVNLGIKPNLIVGDMDSISTASLDQFKKCGTEIRQFPRDKDASDLELALQAAIEYSPSEILCMCVLGRREDHSLTNTFLIGRYAGLGNKISILGAAWQAQFVTSRLPCTFTGSAGDILSLIPMVATASGVTANGVKWPLDNASLPWGSSRTVSNEFIAEQVSVTLTDGLLLAFHYRVES